ncbi:MAG: helix-turn-helix transcriptional regulator [Candidatus Binataceae bacterium]
MKYGADNPEVALGQIKRLANAGLPVEPFVRSVCELISRPGGKDLNFLKAAVFHISHGLKAAQLQQVDQPDMSRFVPLAGWRAGTILFGPDRRLIALDSGAGLILEQISTLDAGDGAYEPAQTCESFDLVAQAVERVLHGSSMGLPVTGPQIERMYVHWSGIVLKLRGLQMIGADGREYTTVLVERGETADSRRRRLIARWGLSAREAEVLAFISEDKTGPEIAILLNLSHDTVRKHTSSILAKLGVETRASAASAVRDFT